MSTPESPEIGRTIDAAGIRTNYLVEGDGPAVILLHGSGPGVTGYANWRLILPRLAPRFTVYAPDIVGFGYTERPPGQIYDLDHWVTHLLGFLDAHGIDRAHLVGNSFGGALSLAMAARHPDRIDRLVLMGSAGTRFEITRGLEKVWGYEPSPEAMAGLMGLFAWNQGLVTPELVESRHRASIRPGYQESYARMFAAPRQARLDGLVTPEEAIRSIRSRVLVTHGREDRVIPLEVGLKLFQLLPHAELHVFGECGHWIQVERAQAFSELVLAFLTRQ